MDDACILIADDVRYLRDLLSCRLQIAGYDVIVAEDGDEALMWPITHKPQVALVDVRMPGPSGAALALRLKQIDPSIETIVLSAYGSIKSAVDAMSQGVFYYLSKPLDTENMLAVVARAVSHVRATTDETERAGRLVEYIRQIPGAFVDCSILQGRDAVLGQLNERTGTDNQALVDLDIADIRDTIAALVLKARPFMIPRDYIFFLEMYGGLAIESNQLYFSVLGVGPMVEEWYASIVSDDALQEPGECGFLSLGSLSFREGKYRFQ